MKPCKTLHRPPGSVNETYFGHMAFAAWFASRLFMAGGAALVHAFLPFLCETTASRIVRELYERTSNRKPGHAAPAREDRGVSEHPSRILLTVFGSRSV